MLSSAARLLQPGGFVVISMPNVAHAFVRLSLLSGRFDYQERGILDRTHLRFFTRRTIHELVRDCGYRIVSEQVTPAPIEEVFTVAADHGKAPWLQSLGAGMARTLPTLFGYQFVIKAEPR